MPREDKASKDATVTTGPDAPGRPFDSIDSSHEFVVQLLQTVEETATEVGEDLRRTRGAAGREREALQLIAYKLEQLRFHLTTSQRRLGELRALRRFLDDEGEPESWRRGAGQPVAA